MWSSILAFAFVINELMASNAGSVMSPAVNFDSWIELYNPTEQAVNLSGMYLSDDENNLTLWQMPSDIGSIPANGYLVVWLGSNDIRSNQAPFKLDCDGGNIFISDQNGQLVTSMEYPPSYSRTAYARLTDGGDEWGWTSTPTPGETNATAIFASERLAAPEVSQGSQLFTGMLNVTVKIPEGATLMYTTDGSLPSAPIDDTPATTDPWIEYVINGDCEGNDASSLISRDADSNGDVARIIDGVGYNNSRGVKIHGTANAANDWAAQFFVYTPNHTWQTGERYRFRFKVRADKNARITTQTHSTPHNYISGSVLDGSYNVTTQWQEYTYEGEITSQQTGSNTDWWSQETTPGTMQTIAFNLNVDKKDNNYYFDDISWELSTEDYVAQPNASKKSEDGQFTVSSTTNLTFRLFKDGYLPSVPVTRSYIQTSNQYTLPVISIVGDRSYFTDPKIGIDCNGDGTNGKPGNGQDQPRNYNMDWNRPVNFSFIGTDGQMKFNQDVDISVSGGWTRSQKYRSFKLKSSKIFDGQNRFDYSFFPQKPFIRNKTILLRNGGNDVWSNNARFTDPALETIIQRSGIDIDVQSYVPIIEYVNGELRGVLNMREPNNDKFAYANWGYDDEELDAFENEEFKNGNDMVLKQIYYLGANINDDGAYAELQKLLDIDEFTNYMAATMFLHNDDWPNNNIKGYRSQHDGRYRFVSFDLDYAFGKCYNKGDNPFTHFNSFRGSSELNHEFVDFFINLLKHDDYRKKFINTFCIVAGSVFDSKRASGIVDELLATVQPMTEMMRNQGIYDGHEPNRAADEIKQQLKNRADKLTSYLQQYSPMQLVSVKRQTVALNADTEGAHILIDGIDVPYADFKGYLFGPVLLEAKVPAGYRFVGWKMNGAIYSENVAIDLPSANSVSLTATFAKLSATELAREGLTPVRINEVSAANGIHVNEYFKRNDWVELYNTTADPIDVEGMYLSDNAKKPLKYQITKGNTQASTIIPAYGYLIVWCDKLDPLSQLHASFKLAADGGDVLLTAADESWTDKLTYTAHAENQTVGRYPDGTGNVFVMNVPTIAASNITSSYVVDITADPSTGITDIMAQQPGSQQIYNLKGQAVQGTLKPGIYIRNGRKVIVRK